MTKYEARKCKLFFCERRNGYICCADCGYREKSCWDYCQNSPERCNQLKIREIKHPGAKVTKPCKRCGEMYTSGVQSRYCPACQRKAHADSAKARNLNAIGVKEIVRLAAERRTKLEGAK